MISSSEEIYCCWWLFIKLTVYDSISGQTLPIIKRVEHGLLEQLLKEHFTFSNTEKTLLQNSTWFHVVSFACRTWSSQANTSLLIYMFLSCHMSLKSKKYYNLTVSFVTQCLTPFNFWNFPVWIAGTMLSFSCNIDPNSDFFQSPCT